jgi:DNA-binding HxlR family transcriptional regulator
LRFRALQTAAETNPAVLNSRLGELKAAMLVELTAEGYQLTTQGNELIKLVLPMHDWAENWSRKIGDD